MHEPCQQYPVRQGRCHVHPWQQLNFTNGEQENYCWGEDHQWHVPPWPQNCTTQHHPASIMTLHSQPNLKGWVTSSHAGFLHHLMGHIGVKGLHSAIHGVVHNNCSYPPCEVCAWANIHCLLFLQHTTSHTMCLLQCVHCDICRPLPASYRNFSYFILFINCFSRFTSHFLMKSCNEALQLFVKY